MFKHLFSLNRFLTVKARIAQVGAFNKEKALTRAFSGHFEISQTHIDSSSECVICSFEPTAAVFVCGTFNNSSKWIIKMFLK